MEDENLKLLSDEELPQTDEPKKKTRPRVNCLQEILIELMNDRGLRDAEVVKATGIPWSTYHGWISGDTQTQLADQNLLKLAKYFNVDLYYLVYGIGEDDPYFKEEENEQANGY